MFFLIDIEVRLTSVIVFVLLSQIFLIHITNFKDIIFLVNSVGGMTIDFNQATQPELISFAALPSIFYNLVEGTFSSEPFLLEFINELLHFFWLNFPILMTSTICNFAFCLVSLDCLYHIKNIVFFLLLHILSFLIQAIVF
jgi:hypothetical protein